MKVIFFLILLLFIPGCCLIHKDGKQDVSKREFSKGDERLKQFGGKILHSVQTGNYKEFAQCVNEKDNKISEEEFRVSEKNIREQFGKITGFEYLTDLELPLMHNLIWKVQFEREGKNQKSVKQELLFRLVLGTINGKPHVVSMGFL